MNCASLLLAQKVVRDFEVEFKTKDGGTRTTSINVGAVADSEGTSFYLEGTVQDITERKAAEARVQFLAYHDALTGLPNRVLFEDRLAKALANARRRQERVAVLWLDLDNFKTINDSLGHSVGRPSAEAGRRTFAPAYPRPGHRGEGGRRRVYIRVD